MLGTSSHKVVLFLPPYAGKVLGPPLSLLSLAGSLRDAGYTPCLIDGALDRNFPATVAREISGALCFGVSLLTGPMIRDAMEMSRLVRKLRPELPIVFGGWHPSLVSAQTLREDFVDIGTRLLVQARRASDPESRPAGCTALLLAGAAYDLIDFDAYERVSGELKLPYATSIGCPYACNYCTDMVFYNRRFNPYDTGQVVEELVTLVREHRLQEVALLDSNFLVDVRRALAIAKGVLKSGVGFHWSFQASTDLLCRMADEDVQTLADSGVNHIGFGTESASPEVLRRMSKAHQSIPDMFEAARKCRRAGIRVTYNLIFGYPGEEDRHRRETLKVMGEIAERFDNVSFSPNVFTPYPGIPIWPQLRALGLPEPQSLLEWADIDLGTNKLPWLQGKSFDSLQRGISYFLLDNQINKMRRRSGSAAMRSILQVARRSLHWRISYSFFDWPLELWLSMAKHWLVVRRSLLTGQSLSHEIAKAR